VRRGTKLALLVVVVVAVLAVGAVSAFATLADDSTPPATVSDAVASYWNTAAVKVTSSDATGVAYIYYRLDGGITRLYTVGTGNLYTTATITAAGKHTLAFWAQDTAGNVEARHTVDLTVAVDKAAPASTATGAVAGAWYKASVPVAIAAADEANGSGVASLSFKWDAALPTLVQAATTSAPLAVGAATANGPHTLTYGANDVAGNIESAKTLTVNVDTVVPVATAYAATATRGKTATLKYKAADALPCAGKATVMLTVKSKAGKVMRTVKAGSVVVGVQKSVKFTVPKTWKAGTYKIYVNATDVAGNVAKVATAKLIIK
jgi:large repetitive protein